MDDSYKLTHVQACVSAFSPLLASSKKLASVHFKTVMVVAFNDAAYGQLKFLRLRLSQAACPPGQVAFTRARRYLFFALRSCELIVLPIDDNR